MSERRITAYGSIEDAASQGDAAVSARHDPARLAAVQAARLLDTAAEEVFDRLSRLAVRLLGVPAAFLSLVDADRDFYKSMCGVGEPLALARELTGPTFCHYAILSPGPLVIPDTAADPLYRDIPTVRTLGVAAYVGVPVEVDGQRVGSLCAIDTRPRAWTTDDVETLEALAASAQREIELRIALARADQLARDAEHARQLAAVERTRSTEILEAMTDAYFALDRDFRIVAVNAAMVRSTGFEREALLGRVFWEMFPGVVGSQYERHYRAAVTRRVPAHFTDSYDDGRLSLVSEADVYPLADGGVAVFWRDVTARVRADAMLRESEDRFRKMADAAPVMLKVTEPDSTCSFLSRAWLDFTGQSFDDALGFGWLEAVHPEDRPRAEREFVTANAHRVPFRADYRLRRHDGVYRWAADASAPRFGPGDEFLGYVGSVLDVDERTRLLDAERAARVAADEARDAAEAANAAKSQFLSTMSHELRTPLHAIGGYTDLLLLGLRGSLNEEQQQDLKRVRLANQHLMALVTDVLNFARIEAGQLEYQLIDVELASIIADLEFLIGTQLVAKGIRFDFDACAPDTPDEPHTVRADPEKLRQILLNLLSNAIKFTESGGEVSILCETDHDANVSRVRVRDTGRGIVAEQLERIFEPFVQVDRHRTPDSQQGVGLGLAISRDLARGMSGDLVVESAPGEGSTFTLTLPMAPRP